MLKLKNKHALSILKKELKKSKDEKYKTRLKAIILVKNGRTRNETAENLVVSLKSLTEWIKIYNESGYLGLRSKKTGRPKGRAKWNSSIFERLAKEIDKSQKYWSVPIMGDWLEKEEKKIIPESTIWYRVTQIGYSHKSSRPYPYKGDKEKQERFKKGALLR